MKKILINCIAPFYDEEFLDYLTGLTSDFAENFPEFKFELILPENFNSKSVNGKIQITRIKHNPSKALFFSFFKKRKLRSLISRSDADKVFSIYPVSKNGAEEYLFASSLINHFSAVNISASKIKKLEQLLSTVNHLIVFSEKEKQLLNKLAPSVNQKATVIYPLEKLSICESDFEEEQQIKEKYADENEFFICPVTLSEDQLILLIKGFSGFKKWQKSGMKLLLTARNEDHKIRIEKLIENYRFKDSLRIINRQNQEYFCKIIGAAYAAIYPATKITEISWLLAALKEKTPAIMQEESVFSEMAKADALYFQNNREDITRQLLTLFKDEQVRAGYIEKGFSQSQNHSFFKMMDAYRNLLIADK